LKTKTERAAKIVAVFAVLVLFSLVALAAESPEDEYFRIVALILQADAVEAGQPGQASAKYLEAQSALRKFQAANPNWNTALVNSRLGYLASKLGAATENASASSGGAAERPAAGGLFPKMPAAAKAFVVEFKDDSQAARRSAFALQGLVNQTSAEAYIISNPWYRQQLEYSRKPFENLERLPGADGALRTLFAKYHHQVKKLLVYDPANDWTWYLALMCGAQQAGLPVTDSQRRQLESESGWNGSVEDLRGRWAGRTEAYDWALAHLMPGCSRQVVFALNRDMPLTDYAVAGKGFVFWLDFKAERAEVEKIFRGAGYGLGTSLMGYANAGDEANAVANPFGIGYVVSDFYANGSFWSSFPNKTYAQKPGKAQTAEPGKIYASLMWSDGDNIQFDQNPDYLFWYDNARGAVPVATQLSPTLLELNSPLLDWYYANLTGNDELVCGPTGVQFIFIQAYRENQFGAWCRLTRTWAAAAGLRSARIWIAPNPSVKYTTWMRDCGFEGAYGEGWRLKVGNPPKIDAYGAWDEAALYKAFTDVKPEPSRPLFVNFTPIVGGFNHAGGGYSALKRLVERIQTEYPGRYVFMLPRDQFATIRAYYDSAGLREVSATPGASDHLKAVSSGDGRFTVSERGGSPCWLGEKRSSGGYLYFGADERFRPQAGEAVEIQVEYLDNEVGEIALEYDSTDIRAAFGGAYKTHPQKIRRTGSAQWRTARFRATDAGFGGSQNDGADFRFGYAGEELMVRSVRVSRAGR
jgi:hypothetical protein